MSRIFVEYLPGHKDEVADTLGIATSAGLVNDVASDAPVEKFTMNSRSFTCLQSVFLPPH